MCDIKLQPITNTVPSVSHIKYISWHQAFFFNFERTLNLTIRPYQYAKLHLNQPAPCCFACFAIFSR